MKTANLVSSNLKSASWDDGNLTVTFNRGTAYQYSAVPEKVFDALVSAESAGSFFAKNIRNNFAYRELSPDSSAPV